VRPPSKYIDKINAKVARTVTSRDSLLNPNRLPSYVDAFRGNTAINPNTLVPALMNQYKVIPIPESVPSIDPYVDFGYVDPGYVVNTP
jgi:hypothetical protein